MTAPEAASFRLGYVPGVTPGKWARMWGERRPQNPLELVGLTGDEAVESVRTAAVDAAVARRPFDRAGLHAIGLYTETTVVVLPKDHVLTVAEEVGGEDLADEIVLGPLDDALVWADGRPGRAAASDPATTADAVELVAAGIGLLVVPQSLARLHHRRDLTYRPVTDAPASEVVLTWPDAENTDLMEEFIGIVRGRTANSTRTRRREDTPASKPSAPARDAGRRRPQRGRRGRGPRAAS